MAVLPSARGQADQRQMLLDLHVQPSFARDDFLIRPTNRDAVALIDAWPDWSSPYAVLAGPVGSGKSHIASIWQRDTGAVSIAPANVSMKAVGTVSPERPVLIDGVTKGNFDETALFHLMNEVRHAGSTLLLTSTTWPSGWDVKTPDLASRLRSAVTVEIGEPDEELLRAVMVKLFADRQIVIETNVIDYLVVRIERSLQAAIETVDALDRLSLAKKCRVTRQLAAMVIEPSDTHRDRLDLA